MKEYSYGIVPYKLEENKIFLLVSKSNKISPFGFIKGKIELSEDIKSCAIREFKEETNLNLNKAYLEEYFYQKNKKKDIGVFLYDFDFMDISSLRLNKEIYSIQFFELNNDLYNLFEKNQKKILNQLFLYFKDLKKIHLKNKFKKS